MAGSNWGSYHYTYSQFRIIGLWAFFIFVAFRSIFLQSWKNQLPSIGFGPAYTSHRVSDLRPITKAILAIWESLLYIDWYMAYVDLLLLIQNLDQNWLRWLRKTAQPYFPLNVAPNSHIRVVKMWKNPAHHNNNFIILNSFLEVHDLPCWWSQPTHHHLGQATSSWTLPQLSSTQLWLLMDGPQDYSWTICQCVFNAKVQQTDTRYALIFITLSYHLMKASVEPFFLAFF